MNYGTLIIIVKVVNFIKFISIKNFLMMMLLTRVMLKIFKDKHFFLNAFIKDGIN